MPPPAVLPAGSIQVRGFVQDTALRRLSGARVEVVDGPQARTSTTTNASGDFLLTGTFDDSVTFRASKDGYIPATGTLRCAPLCDPGYRGISFALAVFAPPAPVAGDYTLTFTANTVCTTLPQAVRTRSYAATITPSSTTAFPANTLFAVKLSGARFFAGYDALTLGVAGNDLTFVFTEGGHGPTVVEEVGPNTYLAFEGSGSTSVATSGVATISMFFSGAIDHCQLPSAMGSSYDCPPNRAVALAQCNTGGHRLMLTRR